MRLLVKVARFAHCGAAEIFAAAIMRVRGVHAAVAGDAQDLWKQRAGQGKAGQQEGGIPKAGRFKRVRYPGMSEKHKNYELYLGDLQEKTRQRHGAQRVKRGADLEGKPNRPWCEA
jgi:hypothetical protein